MGEGAITLHPAAPSEILDQLCLLAAGERRLVIVTGGRGAGKTTWCSELAVQARTRGFRVAGLLSPGVFTNGSKECIDLVDLSSGKRCRLAQASTAGTGDHGTCWHFDEQALAWGNAVLLAVCRADLMIIDELGPLELQYGQGFTKALELLDEGWYRMACVVIRPELLAVTLLRWSHALVITPPDWEQSAPQHY